MLKAGLWEHVKMLEIGTEIVSACNDGKNDKCCFLSNKTHKLYVVSVACIDN